MELTRRTLMARAAAASGAVLVGRTLTPGVVFAGDSGESVFELHLGRGRIDGGRWRSGPVQSARRFELLGVASRSAGIEIRVKRADGSWSEWLHAHAGEAHGPDAVRAPARRLSDPVWTGPARVFEVRAPRALTGARVVLVDPGAPASAARARHFVDAGLPAGPGQPRIIARSSWATAACRPRVAAVFGAIDLAFVHHTVSSNAYRPSQSAAMVRSICLFHKYGNGWNDIGYNFVVDRHGQIFEARAGGIDEAIVGAQAGGYNVYSTGVALLGNFAYHGPPRTTFDALAHLLAWKLSLHGIGLPGTATVRVTRAGAVYSRYRAGTPVTLNRIAGHRDGDSTECPGGGMYRQLPRLRQAVRHLAATPSALTLQLDGVTPGNASVSGLLAAAGVAIGDAVVEIQRRSTTHGAQTVASATTNPDGTWSAAIPLATSALLRAVFRGDGTNAAVVSPGVAAAVPPQIALTPSTQLVVAGGAVVFDGSTSPRKPKVSIVVSQQQPDGTLTPVQTYRLRTNPDGSFSRTIGFPLAGQYQVIAHTSADHSNALGTSPPVVITVA